MTLVDTDVWINDIDWLDRQMVKLPEVGQVVTHSLVIAELALGSLPQRAKHPPNLRGLPLLSGVPADAMLTAIHAWKLYVLAIGAVDARLLCALMLAKGVTLWTRGQHLRRAAEALGVRCVDVRSRAR